MQLSSSPDCNTLLGQPSRQHLAPSLGYRYRLQRANNPARLFGFLLGTATAGAGMYYYVVDEYRVSNQLLTEDIYALQSAVQRIEGYVRTLEEKVGEKRR